MGCGVGDPPNANKVKKKKKKKKVPGILHPRIMMCFDPDGYNYAYKFRVYSVFGC